MVDGSPARGMVAPGFEEVREEFERNLRDRDEIGAACAGYLDGEKVVDLWGGRRDRHGNAWEEDTMVLVYSITKGMAAVATAVAASRGILDLDRPVASYWHEFGAHGKADITVRDVLSHRSGVAGVDRKLSLADLADLDLLADAVAEKAPDWVPGTRQGYHYLTVGWIANEVLERADPLGRTIGRFFREEVAIPLGLDFHIGLPAEIPERRLARIKGFHGARLLLHPRAMPAGMTAAFLRPGTLTARVLGNPRLSSPAKLDDPLLLRSEIPSAGGVGTVRSIARAFGVLATGGTELEITPEVTHALCEPAREPSLGWDDLVLHADLRFSLGFIKPSPDFAFGTGEMAFGSEGAGGSIAFADPQTRSAFAYAPNRLGFHLVGDPRQRALVDAFEACVARRS